MAGSSNSDFFFIVDDLYFSALHDDDEIFPISDEKYAEELQLQEALISSSYSLNQNTSTVSSSSSSSLDSSSPKQPLMTSSETSKSPNYSFCAICIDTKAESEMFQNGSVCGHQFCVDCIRGHVAAKIKENITMVMCPQPMCGGMIGPEVCRSIIPKEVFERWENILCESMIMEGQKFYCPFNDCSAMLVDDGEVEVTSSECPNCHRLFCAQCKVSWHCGMSCVEYQSVRKGEASPNDILLDGLAKNKRWMKCSNCKLFVDKVSGCQHITCKCGHQFCYGCGEPYSSSHVCAAV